MKFENKIALITGGARGIGKAIAEKLNEEGAITLVTYNESKSEAEKLGNEIKFPDRLFLYKLNLFEKHLISDFVSEILYKFTKVDILINNASFSVDNIFNKNFFEYTWDDFIKPFEIDVLGGILLTRGFVKKMMDNRFGRILFFSSANAIKSDDRTLPYAISKCANVGVVKSLAHMFASYNITVNAIAPGAIDTGWIEKWKVPSEWIEKTISNTPVNRLGKPEDIANFVLFLVSDEAGYITGQTISIDGGAYL